MIVVHHPLGSFHDDRSNEGEWGWGLGVGAGDGMVCIVIVHLLGIFTYFYIPSELSDKSQEISLKI